MVLNYILYGIKEITKLPFPLFMGIVHAHVHDLSAIREELSNFALPCVVLDKAYTDQSLAECFEKQDRVLLCPIKARKGESEAIKQRELAYQDLYHRRYQAFDSLLRLFSAELNRNSQIQKASKVRAKAGLGLHVFGKLAAAIWVLLEKLKP